MKKINLNKIHYPEKQSHYVKMKMYAIAIGNGHREYFTNIKDAKKYLAELNRFLNMRLHELNNLYFLSFGEYRRSWFVFGSDDPNMIDHFQKMENNIKAKFDSIDFSFKYCVERSHWQNGNHFTFKHMASICDNLTDILDIIREFFYDRKFYHEIYRLTGYMNQLKLIKIKLENFGKNDNDDSELRDFFTFPEPED
ncbi:MAG: hypothetical protein ACOCWG_02260 [bacterium]